MPGGMNPSPGRLWHWGGACALATGCARRQLAELELGVEIQMH